jgi:flavin reductase (DIM6/NTAB) family NADH-FMN oxidoreductase RutF
MAGRELPLDLDMSAVRADVPLAHACRLLTHGPTVIVSAVHEGRRNLMTAAWSTPVEFEPPRIVVVLDKSTYTRELALASGCLALNLPCRAILDLTYTVGRVDGRELFEGLDKFERFRIASFEGPVLGLPLVEGCVAWFEGRLLREPRIEDTYDAFFVEIVSAQADPRVFAAGRWNFVQENSDLHTLHHLGAGSFALPSATIHAVRLD